MSAGFAIALVVDIAVAFWVARDAQHRDWSGRIVGKRGWMLLTLLLSPLLALVYMMRRPRASVAPPATATTSRSAATGVGWQPDPTGRHELRFWDGGGWTDNVSNAGTSSRDPL